MRRGHRLTPETRAKLSEAQRGYRADPEVWERTMLAANTPQAKAHRRHCSTALWRDPAFRAKALAGIAAYAAARRAREDARIEHAYRTALRRQKSI